MRLLRRIALLTLSWIMLSWSTAAYSASAVVLWAPVPTSSNGKTLAGYRMYWGPNATPPYTTDGSPQQIPLSVLTDPANPSYEVGPLPTCEHLFFACTAYYSDGSESPYSNLWELDIITSPADVTVVPGNPGTVVVDWSTQLSAGDLGSVANYRVHYSLTPVGAEDLYAGTGAVEGDSPVTGAPSLSLSGLTPGDTIYVAVEAVCASGAGSTLSEPIAVLIPGCGSGLLDPEETCDPPSSCPQNCDDNIACTLDGLTGSPDTCNVQCTRDVITSCADGDGCCPDGCNNNTDNDCSVSCGNGVLEDNETCDPPGSCPQSCDDSVACTFDSAAGSAENCSLSCTHAAISACAGGDGCCPVGCDHTTDSDCSATCGNGTLDRGETCDPPSSCPQSCDDGIDCTADIRVGSMQNCSSQCTNEVIVVCGPKDGCCPAACGEHNDIDCGLGLSGANPLASRALQGGCSVAASGEPGSLWLLGLLALVALRLRRPAIARAAGSSRLPTL